MSAVSDSDVNDNTGEKTAPLCTVTTKVERTWKQCAVLIFIYLSQNQPKESGSRLFISRSKGANSEWLVVSKENDTNVGGPCGKHDCRSST